MERSCGKEHTDKVKECEMGEKLRKREEKST